MGEKLFLFLPLKTRPDLRLLSNVRSEVRENRGTRKANSQRQKANSFSRMSVIAFQAFAH